MTLSQWRREPPSYSIISSQI
uniref:Uncharacterized protein n=1 Tax=Phlebotomus papatasi TaxID=29031 RepID=A0A1B0GNX7_PHLPP